VAAAQSSEAIGNASNFLGISTAPSANQLLSTTKSNRFSLDDSETPGTPPSSPPSSPELPEVAPDSPALSPRRPTLISSND
ncbi:MAG: hypothetical protein ACO3FE_13260, partial [Planctomycetaceae bacterium]